jgi:hypothetical protein
MMRHSKCALMLILDETVLITVLIYVVIVPTPAQRQPNGQSLGRTTVIPMWSAKGKV